MSLPVLHIKLPRPVTAIHQIEITSRCNLRCVYCPSSQMMHATALRAEDPGTVSPWRPAVDMAEDVFEAALSLARFFVRQGTQRELNLAGIGESTLHPQFPAWLRAARTFLGDGVRLIFATNGLIVTQEILGAVEATGTRVWVSLHRLEKAGLAVEAYRKIGALDGVSADPSINAYDWAGQVEWFNSPRAHPLACQWIREGKAFVRADASIATCCVDACGDGTIAGDTRRIGDANLLGIQPYNLCRTCIQEIAVHGHNQRP